MNEQIETLADIESLSKRPLWQRRMYLDQVEKSRGKTAADALRAAMRAIWDARDTAKAVA